MTEQHPLPRDGPERDIFLRALRRFSDSCRPPNLIAECPFSVDTKDGRACGEECLDLLARHNAPPGWEEIELSEGYALTIRRPRPRQGPGSHARPFDAGEIQRQEADRPVSLWSAVSLFTTITDELVRTPGDEAARRTKLDALLEELDRRGYQSELLVRFGMKMHLMVGIAVPVIKALVTGEHDHEVEADWVNVAQELAPSSANPLPVDGGAVDEVRADRVSRVMTEFVPLLGRWVDAAPLDDLLDRNAPPVGDFKSLPDVLEVAPKRETESYVWLTERFTQTYLSDWSDESLKLEWAYIHSQVERPCQGSEMRSRRIDEALLSKEMADRYTSGGTHGRGGSSGLPIDELVGPAVEYLRTGRRAEARAVFETVRHLNPSDAEAANNYGFCLLPDDPASALLALEEAARLGYDQRAVNVANRVLCLIRLGRLTTALDLCEKTLLDWDILSAREAYLWDLDEEEEGEPSLSSVDDARVYLAELGLMAARASADIATVEKWTEFRRRVEERVTPPDGSVR